MFNAKDSLGIEIGSQYLKIMHLDNGSEIANWISTDISNLNDDAISDFISNFVKDKGIKTPEVINHIPAANTITKNIELPATNSAEIQQIIKLQAGHYSPYSSDEIVIDYIPLGVLREGYTRVFLIIARRDSINRAAAIIEKAGLKLAKTVLSLETMVLWYKDQAGEPLGILHIDSDKTDFLVIHKEKPLFLRNIPIGAGQLAYDAERFMPVLLEEITHSIDAYQAEHLEPLTKIIVTGATAKITGSFDAIKEKHSMAVETEGSFKELKLSSGLEAVKDALAETSLISLAASLAKYGKTQIDLTPEDVKKKASTAAKGRDVAWISILVVMILLLWTAVLVQGVFMKKTILSALGRESEKYFKPAIELKEKQRKLKQVKSYFARRSFALEVLAEVYDKCITGSNNTVYLTGLSFNDDRQPRVLIKGIGSNPDDVNKMAMRLEGSKYFANVQVKNTTRRVEMDRKNNTSTEVVDFEVLCLFEQQ